MKLIMKDQINSNSYEYKGKNLWLSINITFVFLYIILKMYRNSINNTAEVTGGIWNVFNILFIVLGFLSIFTIVKRQYRFPLCLNIGIVYAVITWFVAFLHLQSLSIGSIFAFLMIPYFVFVTIVFYTYGLRGITKKNKRLLFFYFYIIAAFTLYLMLRRSIYNVFDIYQSDAYFLLCLFPFVLLWKRGLGLYIPFGILTIILIFSGKRNGSIAIVVALFIYFIVEYKVGNRARRFSKILKNLLLVSFIVVAVYLYLSSHYSINLVERFMSLPEDGGSSRDVIYSSVWFAIKNSTMFEWLFGHGTRGIITVFGRTSGAHNDFLEIFYNFGFFSVVIFIVFYIVLISTAIKMIKDKYYGASAFAASIVISLFMSMFSNYVITFTHITSTACFWGIALADWISIKQNRGIPHLSQGSGIL